jgi:hypothetical protein
VAVVSYKVGLYGEKTCRLSQLGVGKLCMIFGWGIRGKIFKDTLLCHHNMIHRFYNNKAFKQ